MRRAIDNKGNHFLSFLLKRFGIICVLIAKILIKFKIGIFITRYYFRTAPTKFNT